jgi:hypothetical protein
MWRSQVTFVVGEVSYRIFLTTTKAWYVMPEKDFVQALSLEENLSTNLTKPTIGIRTRRGVEHPNEPP